VQKLDLSLNKIGPKGAEAVEAMVAAVDSVTSLSTAHNNISGKGARQLASAVMRKPTLEIFSGILLNELRANRLTTLDLPGKGLGVVEAMVLADLLTVMASPTALSLRENGLDDEGVTTLCEALQNSQVQELDLSDTDIGTNGLKAVADMIAVVSSLTSLSLGGRNVIGDDGAAVIARALKNSKTCNLASLNLSGEHGTANQIGAVGARGLAEYISVSASLTILSIQDNFLGDDGTKLLCDALSQSTVTNIEELNFYENNIEWAGARAVGQMAAVVASLTKINLSANFLGDRGVIALCDALKNSKVTKLQQLEVADNGIGDIGAEALVQMVANVTSLNFLDVDAQTNEDGGHPLSDAGTLLLQQARRPGLEIYVS